MTKKDKVIILKKTIYHEYDEVVSVIGKEHGLFAFFAPGVRKPASRNKNGLILFSYSEVEVFLSYFTYRLSRLKKSLPQEIYLKSQTDLAYVRVLSFFSQIYTRFLTQRQPNPSAFNMLLIFLRKTNQKSICTLPFFVTLAFNFLF